MLKLARALRLQRTQRCRTRSGITGLFACVTVPFIGALSDSIGRKRLMLLSCVLDVLPFGTLVATENMCVNTEHALAR